jgi:hypothetical protein
MIINDVYNLYIVGYLLEFLVQVIYSFVKKESVQQLLLKASITSVINIVIVVILYVILQS